MTAALADLGLAPSRIHTEMFASLSAINPGVVAADRPPRTSRPSVGTGPMVTFARAGITHRLQRRRGQPARDGRGLRRPDPMVLPHRRLPHLLDAAAVGRGHATHRTRSPIRSPDRCCCAAAGPPPRSFSIYEATPVTYGARCVPPVKQRPVAGVPRLAQPWLAQVPVGAYLGRRRAQVTPQLVD